MKNVRQFPRGSLEADFEDKTSEKTTGLTASLKQKTNLTIIKNNPKIDRQLVAEHERLEAASKGVVRVKKRGADYNLSHPLARKDMPTDAYHLGKSVKKRGADYNLAHPLARKDMPTDAYHLGKSMSEVKKS